ncbi:energy transducer TonB [Gelidibacter sp.]|uniref:energy transducer TonB n=1 Tax=Gelidibacter sp. TaxID=2018083 RepID=UPI00326662D4
MENLKKCTEVTANRSVRRAKPHKHDANLRKNSALYFQVGLILCLLLSYGLFEMRFEEKNLTLTKVNYVDPNVEVFPTNFILEKEVFKQKNEVIKNQVVLTINPIVKDNDFVENLPTELLTESPIVSINPAKIEDIVVFKKDDDDDIDLKVFSTIGVEMAPVYPGCESQKNNEGLLKCMSDKLSQLVQKKFDKDLASELGLSGTQKINVVFKIDKLGVVTEVQTRAPRPELEREAKRVVEQIPKMTPGKQRERPVTVQYVLPITFNVQ